MTMITVMILNNNKLNTEKQITKATTMIKNQRR